MLLQAPWFGVKIPESLGILADNLFLCKKNILNYETGTNHISN